MWQRGVTLTISKFASLIKDVRRMIGFGDLFFGIIKIIGLVGSLVKIDELFSEGKFEKYPKKDWVDGSFYAIEKMSELVGKQSIFSAIGEAIGDFFGIGGKSTVLKLVDGIVQIDNAFSKGDFTKYPKVEWINGTIYALQKFHTILDMLSFNSGGFTDSISNLFGGKSPIEQTVSDITLLAMAFEKLGSAMNSFSSSINSLDAEKLGLVKGMSNNIILMSLMDPDMLEDVLDKIEEKGGIFAELIKDFDDKKTTSPTATPVRVATAGTGQKSESQILGEKVDKMTGLLADISSVVGSRGVLKNYLLSVKQNQLSNTTSSPSNIGQSDRRLKNILKKIGQSNLGINIYHFTYTFNTKVIYQGVIAQELIGTQFEGALILDKNGFYSVDYSKLDVEFKKISTSNTF